MITTLIALAFTVVAQSPNHSPSAASPAESCMLAPSLRDALQQRFGSSRILKPSDLYEDERGLFAADHRGACPGMVAGRFFSASERAAFALVLLEVGPKKTVRLVVARPAMSTWTFFEVEEMDQGSTPVVWRQSPVSPVTQEGSKPRPAATDAVVFVGYESWERVYTWNGRRFERLERKD